MKKIVLISCSSKKLYHRAKASDLYISPLFKLNLAYARKIKPDLIYILSAKYGVLPRNSVISPYNKTLNNFSDKQIKAWAINVIRQLRRRVDLNKDHFIFLAGNKYRKHLIPYLTSHDVPLKGLRIGKQLKRLKQML